MTVQERTIRKARKAELIIIRDFNATKDQLFSAFSEPRELEKWWGPKGSRINVVKFEFKTGGFFHYMMEFEGQKMWGRFVYGEIQKPNSLEFINSFSDEKGGITRAPFSQTWPLEIFNNWTLSEENGKTTLTLSGYPINATEEEIKTFRENEPSLRQGFAGTFDQLD
ncbi:MAG: SRPBCC domain-containing protein, partial [Bacteroidota bacterium]|nr:SRPBCC domain-containing protein [Bacteroidota bacterium]